MPVVAAFGSRAALHPFAELLLDDVVAVVRLAGLRIEGIVDVLKHGFLVAEILAVLAIVLPENAVLAGAENQLLAAIVDQDALEYFIQIERFAGSMIEVPRELAGIDIQSHGRVGVERRAVARLRGWPASRAWPAPRPNRSGSDRDRSCR